MSILSQLQNCGTGLPQIVQGFFKDDRLYRYIVDDSQPSYSLCVQPHSQMTPFPLGQVCYYWRSLTLSMRDLWQSLFIGPPRMEHIPLVEMWLNRAGDYPLSLWLFQSQCPSDQELQATDAILSLLVTRFHRWRNITIQLSAVVHQALLNLPHGGAACLEAARVNVPLWDFTSADNLWRALHSSPNLCRPEWGTYYAYDRKGPPTHAPWAQLTHIRLDCRRLTANVASNILQYCKRAVEISLPVGSSRMTQMPSRMTPFVLAQLRIMRITTDTELGSLFQNLILPSLEALYLNYQRQAFDLSSSLHLADLLSRSQCQLRTLMMYADNDSCEKVITDYLRTPALQSLIELRLRNLVSDETVKLFSKDSGGKQLFPRLQTMALNCCTSEGTLSAMVVSRLPTLRTIRFVLRRKTHSYFQDRTVFTYMQENGHDIKVEVFGFDIRLVSF